MKIARLSSTIKNINLVQNVLECAPSYSLIISGQLPAKDEGQDVFEEIPPGISRENKIVLGIFIEDEMIGIIDYLVGYPDEETAYLGLLLLKESFQQKSHGEESFQLLEEVFRQTKKIKKIRLSVVETNLKAITFWNKMGFQLTGEKKDYHNKKVSANVLLMEKILERPLVASRKQ